LDAGLPSALANVPILDKAGRLTGVPDLFDVEAGVAVEYDGADHRSRRRHAADVDRESDFREAGCALVRVVAPNLLGRCGSSRASRPSGGGHWCVRRSSPGWRLGDPGPSLDEQIADREAFDRRYQAWLDDPVGPPPH
jgi:hypothetical protein